LHRGRGQGLEDLELLPEVLRLLAQLVEVLIGRAVARLREPLPSGPVDPIDPRTDRWPGAAFQTPSPRAPAHRLERPSGGLQRRLASQEPPPRAELMTNESVANRCEARAVGSQARPDESVERLDKDLRVADGTEGPRRVPKLLVLP